MFVGRKQELKAIQSVLEKRSGSVLVYGKRKVGKTTLILEALKGNAGKTVYYECLKSSLQDNIDGFDCENKDSFNWISVIRLPDFITSKDFDWAVETASKKKKLDCSSAEFLTVDEGLCVQIMHIGSFDSESASIKLMDEYLNENGYMNDINEKRLHHEIYMSDARKVAPEKWKTVIRHPIKKV